MLTPDIVAAVELQPAGNLVAVQAAITAERPRPLTWRLVVETQSPGGRSRSVQRGSTTGAERGAVSVVRVNADAIGQATLEVSENGAVVATEAVELTGRP